MSKEYDPVEMQFDGDRDAKQKANRLRFHQWLFQKRPEKRQPQTPLPKNLPSTEEHKPEGRVRGRPFQKGWNKPGI